MRLRRAVAGSERSWRVGWRSVKVGVGLMRYPRAS